MTNIVIENAPGDDWQKITRNSVREYLKTNGINPQASVNVFFVTKRKMRSLNLKYRKIDSSTDVLSFPIWESKTDIPATGEVGLGDIFICPEEMEFKKLGFLIRHSLDHLIGKHH